MWIEQSQSFAWKGGDSYCSSMLPPDVVPSLFWVMSQAVMQACDLTLPPMNRAQTRQREHWQWHHSREAQQEHTQSHPTLHATAYSIRGCSCRPV